MVLSKYEKLVKFSKKAYPKKSGKEQQNWVNQQWRSVREDPTAYEALIKTLKLKIDTSRRRQASL